MHFVVGNTLLHNVLVIRVPLVRYYTRSCRDRVNHVVVMETVCINHMMQLFKHKDHMLQGVDHVMEIVGNVLTTLHLALIK